VRLSGCNSSGGVIKEHWMNPMKHSWASRQRLSQNSETTSKNFEKHHQNTLDQNKNAPYRKCGRSFFDSFWDLGVLRQSRHAALPGFRLVDTFGGGS
jgi:hypothetical protein